MGPKTTPSLISKGGYQIPSPPLAWGEIDTPWEIGLNHSATFRFLPGYKTNPTLAFFLKHPVYISSSLQVYKMLHMFVPRSSQLPCS